MAKINLENVGLNKVKVFFFYKMNWCLQYSARLSEVWFAAGTHCFSCAPSRGLKSWLLAHLGCWAPAWEFPGAGGGAQVSFQPWPAGLGRNGEKRWWTVAWRFKFRRRCISYQWLQFAVHLGKGCASCYRPCSCLCTPAWPGLEGDLPKMMATKPYLEVKRGSLRSPHGCKF